MQTTQRARATRRYQRAKHAEQDRAAWRAAPATEAQIRALRTVASVTGHTFDVAITRGAAWRRLAQATRLLDRHTREECAPPWYTPPAERISRASGRAGHRRHSD
jgi:hypothetical protein